jgi:hypothetical protein
VQGCFIKMSLRRSPQSQTLSRRCTLFWKRTLLKPGGEQAGNPSTPPRVGLTLRCSRATCVDPSHMVHEICFTVMRNCCAPTVIKMSAIPITLIVVLVRHPHYPRTDHDQNRSGESIGESRKSILPATVHSDACVDLVESMRKMRFHG